MAGNNLGANFSIDVTDLKAGLAQANRLIRDSESEFREAAAGMDDWTKSAEGLEARNRTLTDQIEIQKKKVAALVTEKQRIIDKMTEEGKSNEDIARAVDGVNKQIANESKQLDKLKGDLSKNEKALDDLSEAQDDVADSTEDAADATDEAGEKFKGLKSAAGIAAKAVAAVAAAAVAAVGALLGLAESTRESRENMAKLETGFTTAGHSAEDAANTYRELYGILGDDGQATEAAAHLAQLTDNQEDLAKWTDIATGVYATFGDSLPIEGLTEAANETAKTGAITGGLADALNWAGVSEDEFQASLDACSSEQERQALITDTLNGLYGEAADKYKEVNADVIAANEAQANLNQALNDLGAIAEPIMTTLKTMAAGLLTTITPFVQLIGEGLTGALNGTSGAADTLALGLNGLITTALQKIVEIAPFIIETIVAIIPTLLTEILGKLPDILQTLLTVITQVAQSLADMLPTLIPIIIDTIILLAETLLDNIDMIIDAGISLLMGLADGLIAALPRLIEKIPVIIDKLITAITNNLPKLIEMGIQLIVKLALGLIQAIPQLVSKIPQIISAIVKGLGEGLSAIGEVGLNLVKGLWNGIKDAASWILEKIKGFGQSILDGIKGFFGINSPSKVMSDMVGKNLALGIGEGFTDEMSDVNKDIAKSLASVEPNVTASINTANSALASDFNGSQRGGVAIYQTNNYSQAHSRYELYKSKQQTAAAVRLAIGEFKGVYA